MKTTDTDCESPPDFNETILTDHLLHAFFDAKEIYEYANDVSSEYKYFREDVINHLKFLQRRCKEGIKNDNIKVLNGVINHITSFLIKNSLIDYKDDEI